MLRHYYKERLKHALRFRTKRGYGVHSPYMFNLIMKVLRDKRSNLYHYPVFNTNKNRDKKLLRLSYRIFSFMKPELVYISGVRSSLMSKNITTTNYTTDFSQIESCSILWFDTPHAHYSQKEIEQLEHWATTTSGNHSILITNINKDSKQRELWLRLTPLAKVKVEMMWCGLLIFDTKLQVGSYHMLP